MRILYFSWGENSREDLTNALMQLQHEVLTISSAVTDYLVNPELTQAVTDTVRQYQIGLIFSMNYFPFLSEAAKLLHIPYVSWVYDCPHWTLYSPTIQNECNRIFLFDQAMVSLVQAHGASHAFHLPLAVNTSRIDGLIQTSDPSAFRNEVAFVGSLYENNPFNRISYLPDELRGFLDGILAAQNMIYGQDLLGELLTDDLVDTLGRYVSYSAQPLCPIPPRDFFLNMLQTKLTSTERISAIEALAKAHPVRLYTASDATLCPDALPGGAVSYTDEMPLVFHRAKINLNLTLRSITSGIPLRAMDIMGCGGFLLTNYQPELAQYFQNGVDYVYFEDEADLLAKTDYYLSHQKERIEIAKNGLYKIKSAFTYEHQLTKIFEHL